MWRKELQQDTLDGRQQQRSFIRFLNRYWSDVDQNENLSKACPCFLGPNPASRNQSVHLFRHSRLLIIDGWAKGNLLSVTMLLGNLSQLPGLEIELIILKAFFTKRKMCVCVCVYALYREQKEKGDCRSYLPKLRWHNIHQHLRPRSHHPFPHACSDEQEGEINNIRALPALQITGFDIDVYEIEPQIKKGTQCGRQWLKWKLLSTPGNYSQWLDAKAKLVACLRLRANAAVLPSHTHSLHQTHGVIFTYAAKLSFPHNCGRAPPRAFAF